MTPATKAHAATRARAATGACPDRLEIKAVRDLKDHLDQPVRSAREGRPVRWVRVARLGVRATLDHAAIAANRDLKAHVGLRDLLVLRAMKDRP